jgi:hypothetical protein
MIWKVNYTTKKTVAIIRIMYGGRDIDKHLNVTEE